METITGGSLILQFIIIIVLTGINAFFSSAEMAIVSINKFQLYEDEEIKKLIKEKEVITLNENNKLLKFDFK